MEELSKIEKVLARFPGLGKKIFNQLDDQNFCKCNWVSRSLRKCIAENEPLWTRVIKKYNANQEKFKDAWKLVLEKVPVQNVEDLAITVEQFLSFIDDHEKSFVMRRKEHPSKYIAAFCSLRIKQQHSPHYIAAECGCLSLYKFIALRKEMLNPTRPDKLILHLAAQEGHFDICQHFMNNLDIGPIHETEFTAIVDTLGDFKYMAKRLQNFNTRRPTHGLTPLHVAAQEGKLEVVKYNVENIEFFWNKNPYSIRGWTPLHLAARNGHLKVFDYISRLISNSIRELSRAINLTMAEGFTSLHLAASEGHFEIVKYILGIAWNKNPANLIGTTPLHMAARKGHLEIYKFIADQETNKNPPIINGRTPLHEAAKNGHVEIYKFIADQVDSKNPFALHGRTPLHHAVENGHIEIVKYIMDVIDDKNLKDEEGSTPMYLAIKHGHYEVFEFIIGHGGNPNAARQNGRTILHDAAANGNIIIVNYLMDFIANKSLKDTQGLTPMHLAVKNGDFEVFKALIDNGADPNPVGINSKTTPLHIAAAGGYIEIVKYILDKMDVKNLCLNSYYINLENEKGATPMHLAVHQGNNEVCKVLIDHGADPNPITYGGGSAIDLAGTNQEIQDLILTAGRVKKEKEMEEGKERTKRKLNCKLLRKKSILILLPKRNKFNPQT